LLLSCRSAEGEGKGAQNGREMGRNVSNVENYLFRLRYVDERERPERESRAGEGGEGDGGGDEIADGTWSTEESRIEDRIELR
jgi:hypothetical protein